MTFKPEDWPRVKALFGAALEVDGAARAAFVVSACGDDVDLRRQVEMLLASISGPAASLKRQHMPWSTRRRTSSGSAARSAPIG